MQYFIQKTVVNQIERPLVFWGFRHKRNWKSFEMLVTLCAEPETTPNDVVVVPDSITDTEAILKWTQVDTNPDLIHGFFRGYRVWWISCILIKYSHSQMYIFFFALS